MSYALLSDSELFLKTKLAAQNEKAATMALLEYLEEIDRRKLYLEKAYPSLFEYVVRELGYSESQTADRVNAVKLMKSVPEVKKHLEDGALSLTTVSQIQRFVRAESKAVQEKGGRYSQAVSSEVKESVVQSCLNLSKRDVEKHLLSRMTDEGRVILQEKVRAISEERTELRFSVNVATVKKLERLKELLGNRSLESVFDAALDVLIAKEEKKRGVAKSSETAASSSQESVSVLPVKWQRVGQMKEVKKLANAKSLNEVISLENASQAPVVKVDPYSRYVPIEWKRQIFRRSGGRCEFKTKDHQRCGSRFQLQIDHIQPLALGGRTELLNLRHLCGEHNLREARRFGLLPTKRV